MGETRKYRSKTIPPLILALISCAIMLVSAFVLPFLDGTKEYKEMVDAGTAIVGETFLEGTSLSAKDTKELTIFELARTGFESWKNDSDQGNLILGIVNGILIGMPILILLLALVRLPILYLILSFIPAGAYALMVAALQDGSKDYTFGLGQVLYPVGLGLLFISAIWMIVGKSKDKRRRRELERAATSMRRREDPPFTPDQRARSAVSEQYVPDKNKAPAAGKELSLKPFIYCVRFNPTGAQSYEFFTQSGQKIGRIGYASPLPTTKASADLLGTHLEADLQNFKERGNLQSTKGGQSTSYLVSATSCGHLLQFGDKILQVSGKTEEFTCQIEDGDGNPLLLAIPVPENEFPAFLDTLSGPEPTEVSRVTLKQDFDPAVLMFILAVL